MGSSAIASSACFLNSIHEDDGKVFTHITYGMCACRACMHTPPCVYILPCMHYTHIHTHTRTHTKHARVYAPYTRASPRARTHTNTHMHVHSHIHAVAPGICVHARARACKGTHTHPRSYTHTHTHTVTCRHIRPYIRHAFPPCNYIHTQTCLHDTHACLEGRRARVCARQGCTLACKQGIKKISNAMMVEDFIS